MIERFEVGKSYRWIGGEKRPCDWCQEGRMDFLLDGKYHKCTKSNGMMAAFEESENSNKDGLWGLLGYEEDFEESK